MARYRIVAEGPEVHSRTLYETDNLGEAKLVFVQVEPPRGVEVVDLIDNEIGNCLGTIFAGQMFVDIYTGKGFARLRKEKKVLQWRPGSDED